MQQFSCLFIDASTCSCVVQSRLHGCMACLRVWRREVHAGIHTLGPGHSMGVPAAAGAAARAVAWPSADHGRVQRGGCTGLGPGPSSLAACV